MTSESTFRKTRIAPTPSGFLHLGNAYSFLLTAEIARTTGAGIVLRIDDMDRGRMRAEYVKDIFETLEFLDIKWTQGPTDAVDFHEHFSQSHRLAMYEDLLRRLVETGLVYACDCSRSLIASQGGHRPENCRPKKIPPDTPDVAWRIDTDESGILRVKNFDGSETEALLGAESAHFIVRKRDGFPAYQVTSLADDLHFGIDLIVRGEDLWPSTLSQVFLAKLLGATSFADAVFFHHPLIKDDGGRKLSKSEGDTSIRYFRQRGFSKADVMKMLPVIRPF